MIALYFSFATFMLGLFSPVWFGAFLPPVRRLRKGAKWLDIQTVNLPAASSLTVHTIRETDKCGDKVVVVHHLADWTRDLQRKIFHGLVINAAISFVLIVIFIVKSDAALLAPNATFTEFFDSAVVHWPFSVVLAGSLVEVGVFIKLVSDQGAKYAKIIEAARPQRKSLTERMRGWFGTGA